jgi:hypothetical protein
VHTVERRRLSMTHYICTIPAVPLSLNVYTRLHWAEQAKAREAFQRMVWAVLNEAGNKCPRGLERVELHSEIQFTGERRRDSDNYGAVLNKWVQDVLVREGVIPDDTHDRCRAMPPKLIVGPCEQTVVIVKGE